MSSEPSTTIDPAELGRYRDKYRHERDKRIDPDRRRILDLEPDSEYLSDPYTAVVEREPVTDEVDVLVVGGGFGGLLSAVHLRKQGVRRIRIVEKAGDVGGVWYWNRYPGAMCDVESYIYLPLLEEMGYVPERRYSFAPEILAYQQKIAKRFELYDLALFHTAVNGLSWDATAQRWVVGTDRGDRFTARYAVVAHGSFTSLKLPAIEGIGTFRGKIFHTSRWDYEYTGGDSQSPLAKLGDKTVGVVGTGATAVQVVPPVGQAAKATYVFQRTPSTVGPRNNSLTDREWAQAQEPGWQLRRRENFTDITNGDKAGEDLVQDGWTVFYNAMLANAGYSDLTPQERASRRELLDLEHMESIRARIDQTVTDRAVAEALKPYYRYQCKRPCFHDEYLPAFNLPNVHLVDTDGRGITRITENALVVGDTEYPVDCLILATGFDQDSSYVRRIGFDVTGAEGVTLSQKWADGPETLHGVSTSGFPNFFFLPTNNMQGTAAINFVHTLEETAIHVAAVIAELDRRGVIADPDRRAELDYVDSVVHGAGLALLGSGQFLKDCTPGRWNNEGDPDAKPAKNINFPGTSATYFGMLREWREQGDLKGLTLEPRREASA